MAGIIEQLDNGVTISQATDDAAFKNNIYCERSYCDPNSRRFIFQRHVAGQNADQKPRFEYVACEFGTWKSRVLCGPAANVYTIEILPSGELCALRNNAGGKSELIRIDLESSAEKAETIAGGPFTCMAASPDGRYLACSYTEGGSPKLFGVDLIDLTTGARKTIIKDRYVFNPHLQFEPRNGKWLLVQYNRDSEFGPDGRLKVLGRPEGDTLFAVTVPEGRIEWLKIGRPYTLAITGHEDWIPGTDEVLLTTFRKREDGTSQISLTKIAPGKDETILSETAGASHVHASECGRYYCGDRYGRLPDEKGRAGEIILGSIKTGKWVKVCRFGNLSKELRAEYKKQGLWYPDATPYFSPDLKWIVFNDATSGPPQLCVASIPQNLLDSCN